MSGVQVSLFKRSKVCYFKRAGVKIRTAFISPVLRHMLGTTDVAAMTSQHYLYPPKPFVCGIKGHRNADNVWYGSGEHEYYCTNFHSNACIVIASCLELANCSQPCRHITDSTPKPVEPVPSLDTGTSAYNVCYLVLFIVTLACIKLFSNYNLHQKVTICM